ncbi:MAG: hypothetical protein IT514_04520 [Burkholderiales bacterium]|nr:hypothetical protein [Burkholderiales bacterium]
MIARLQALERSEPLGECVYATLRDYLRAGRVAHGQPLQEAALALVAGDGEAAAAAMRAHLEQAKRILVDKIRRS